MPDETQYVSTDPWEGVLEDAADQAGLPTQLLGAISEQEGVHPRHNNPLGLSTDAGVQSFDSGDAVNRIYRQARLMNDPNGPYREYVRTGNINALARVYSPVGARNDPYHTNVTEASGITSALKKRYVSTDPNGAEIVKAEPAEPSAAPTPTAPDHSAQWNQEQAAMQARATQVGMPDIPNARDRLIDAISRSEQAGFHVPHQIGQPKEPTGDYGMTMDVQNLVRSLREREKTDPSVAKERAYWENELKSGMYSPEAGGPELPGLDPTTGVWTPGAGLRTPETEAVTGTAARAGFGAEQPVVGQLTQTPVADLLEMRRIAEARAAAAAETRKPAEPTQADLEQAMAVRAGAEMRPEPELPPPDPYDVASMAAAEREFRAQHPRIYGLVNSIRGLVPTSLEDLKQMATLPRFTNVEEQMQGSEEWGKRIRGEYGPEAQGEAIGSTLLQAAPLLHLPFAESPFAKAAIRIKAAEAAAEPKTIGTPPTVEAPAQGTLEAARFQGVVEPTTADITRQAVEWRAPLVEEAQRLGREADLQRRAGNHAAAGIIDDRIGQINEQLAKGFQPREIAPEALEKIGEEIPTEEVIPSASEVTSAKGVPSEQVRPGVDEEAPLREQGQAAPVREGEQPQAETVTPEEGPITAHALRPALRLGKEGPPDAVGEQGQTHADVIKAQPEVGAEITDEATQHGFDLNGKFLTREEAAAGLGEKEPLTSQRLRELQRKPPPLPEPREPVLPQRADVGARQEALGERYGIEPGTVAEPQEIIDAARARQAKGTGDPYAAATKVKAGQGINSRELANIVVEHERLANTADALEAKAQANPTPENLRDYGKARKHAEDFAINVVKPAGTAFGEYGRTLQEVAAPEPTTLSKIRQIAIDRLGRELKPAEGSTALKISRKVKADLGKADAGLKRAMAKADQLVKGKKPLTDAEVQTRFSDLAKRLTPCKT